MSWDLRGAFPPVKATSDPKEVGPLLRLLDDYEGMLPVRCVLRLAPLLFVRPGELRKAEWADIDLEGAEWRYTVTKTNTPHVVPLARQVVEILRQLHPVMGSVPPGGLALVTTPCRIVQAESFDADVPGRLVMLDQKSLRHRYPEWLHGEVPALEIPDRQVFRRLDRRNRRDCVCGAVGCGRPLQQPAHAALPSPDFASLNHPFWHRVH